MWNCRVIIQLSVMVTRRSAHQIELKTKYLSCIWAHFSGGKLMRNEIFVMYLSWLFWRQFVSHWRICRFAPSKQFTQTLMAILMLSNVMLIFLINKGKCASNLQNIVRSLFFSLFSTGHDGVWFVDHLGHIPGCSTVCFPHKQVR